MGQKIIAISATILAVHLPRIVLSAELLGRMVGVADGDSITVLDQAQQPYKIRLAGIDAPEKKQPFDQRSKQALSETVFDQRVTVDWTKRDKYGRLVGKVILPNGSDTNLRQIERSLAWHYKAYASEQTLSDRNAYVVAEQRARQERAGLWAELEPIPPWEFRHKLSALKLSGISSIRSSDGREMVAVSSIREWQ